VTGTTWQPVISSLFENGVALRIHCGALLASDPRHILSQAEIALLNNNVPAIVLEVMRRPQPSAALPTNSAPLSFQQEFALEHFGDSYGGPTSVHILGKLDGAALTRSIAGLVKRHGALRTRIIVTPECLLQQTDAHIYRAPETLDLEIASAARIDAAKTIRSIVSDWFERGESTFEARLLRLSDTEHILTILWDHLFMDYYSAGLLFNEMWTSYFKSTPNEKELPRRGPMQYSDYAIWQRQSYPEWTLRHEKYWNHRLADAVPLQVPEREGTLISQHVQLPSALGQSLKNVANRIGVSIAITVISLLAVAIAAQFNLRRFTLPMTFSGRTRPQHLNMIGYTSGFVPLRVDLGPHTSFSNLCRGLSTELLSGITHLEVGKALDGQNRDLILAPFVQWFPSTPRDVIAPVSCERELEAAGLTIQAFSEAAFERGSGRQRPGSRFLPGLMLREQDGSISALGVFPLDLRDERFLRLAERVLGHVEATLVPSFSDSALN